MHDVGEVDPLVTVPIPVLCRVGLRSWYLAHTHSLRVVRADEHGRLPVASARRLRAQAASIQVTCTWLSVANSWLHYLDGATVSVVSLLDIRK